MSAEARGQAARAAEPCRRPPARAPRGAGPPRTGLSLAAGAALALLAAAPAPAAEDAPEAPAPARRVVSLNPSLTAILVAIGARDVLVGVDAWSAKSVPGVGELPTVGGLRSPSLEAVAAVEPELVALVPSAEQRGFRARLRELGVPVLAFDPLGFDEVLETILDLGRRVGREDAARERVAAIRRTRARVERATRALPRARAVLVLQRDPLYVVAGGSFVHEMLEAAGAVNVAAEAGFDEPYPRVSREWLVEAAPEVLLDSTGDAPEPARYWAQWPSLPAVGSGRVVALDQGVATLPGPWLDRALRRLARALHGEALEGALDAPERGAAASARPAAAAP